MRVSLAKSDKSFSAAPGRSLLDAALDAGLRVPHSCKGGNCGACRARLLRGEVDYPAGPPLGLADSEAAAGHILLCRAHARSDLELELDEIRPAGAALVKRLPCRIERVVHLSHDVVGLHLRLPAAEEFQFEAGQYVDVLLSGGRRRSFSIASPPHDARPLELHVRRAAGGEFSERVFGANVERMLLTIEGPYGQLVVRDTGDPSAVRAPLLLVGGGTGVAPLISILRHFIDNGVERDMALYWGVRSERDLYAHEVLLDLARRAGRLRYVPVLSEPGADWAGRRGWVHQAVIDDFARLDQHEILASGPPAMIEAVRRDFAARGARGDRVRCDSFDYAPDTLERQRISAATKS